MQVLEQRDLGKRDGFDLVAYKVVDEDTSPDDFDCYDEDDATECNAGHWSFVGVVVKASREGIDLGEDSLWGVEDGYMSAAQRLDNPTGRVDAFDYTLGEDGADMPGEAIHQAKKVLAKLRAADRKAAKRWPRRRRVSRW